MADHAGKRLTPKQRIFAREYISNGFNATRAAINACYSEHTAAEIGYENLRKPEIKQTIRMLLAERTLSEDEILVMQTEYARSNLGLFFKASERWTEFPLPTQEIIGEKDAIDDDGQPVHLYLVRCIVVDLEKLLDPALSRMVKGLSDSPRGGIKIELYDAQRAGETIGKHLGMFDRKPAGTADDPVHNVNYTADEWKQLAASRLAEAQQTVDAFGEDSDA